MKQNALLNAMNRGVISPLALARTDLKRTALSAEIQTNYMPRTLGSMMLRPGYEYIDSTKSDAAAIHIPFIFSIDNTAILELTDSVLRIRIDEDVLTRPSVTTTISNGTFDSNLNNWTDADESGATSQWVTGGYMGLTGTTFNAAIRTQQVTVSGGNINTEHGIRVVIARGPVTLKIGSAAGTDDYVTETSLKTGTYSFAVTPTGDMHISLSSLTQAQSLVDSVTIESAGAVEITTPWNAAALPYIRWDQSGDVVFCCDGTVQQRRIERRATRSWGIAVYQPNDGPFLSANTGTTTITPSAISGDITLTASKALFRSSHVGALFSITSTGQNVSAAITAENQWSDPIRVTGVGNARQFALAITGTWTATVRIQQSVGAVGSWANYVSYSGNTTDNQNDGLDNQIVFYRIGVATGEFTSGTANVSLTYASGSITGFARITAFSTSLSVSAAVVKNLGGTTATSSWAEGAWSTYRGFPSANTLYEGRLWWAGKDKIYGSVSDAFDSFDSTTEGDSGPISRSIGSGPVDRINWLLPLLRLMVGSEMAERSARSSSLDEVLTPTNFNLKTPSTRGCSPVPPIKIDSSGLFVRLNRLFELSYSETYSSTSDYGGEDLTVLCPEIGNLRFTRIAVQRYPDTRVHAIRDDGKVAVLVYDRVEDVKCWILVETDGEVEDVFVLPAEQGEVEDKVYYLVKRVINGSTKRFLERWATEAECSGGTTIYDSVSATVLTAEYPDGTVVTARDSSGTKIGNYTVSDNTITLGAPVTFATITPAIYKHGDSHITYSGIATTTVTAAHLEGESVVVWADGKDMGTYTIASGTATLPVSVQTYMVGLGAEAKYKSTKLAYAAQGGTALTQRKLVNYLGVILSNTHIGGLKYGQTLNDADMDDLPLIEGGQEMDTDHIYASYDKDQFEFPGDYDTDSRLCLKSAFPKPCTVLAAVVGMQTNETL
jgi:hypothetical protein